MMPKTHFRIIEADASHVGFLSTFGSDSFIEAYASTLPLPELEKYTATAFSESTVLDEINGSLATYFICLDSTSIPCGYSKLLLSNPPDCINPDGSIELQRLYVNGNYRSQGIGKLLSLHGESYARNRRLRNMWLRVWEGNTRAQEAYLRWSYSVVGKEPYQVGDDERTVVLMCKSLTGE